MESAGHDFEAIEAAHDRQAGVVDQVESSIPADQRRVLLSRADLPRFLFNEDDIVIAIGQDGLIPNAAKYLRGQPVIGINPDPERYDGVLCVHAPSAVDALLRWARCETVPGLAIQHRTMATAVRDDGQALLALNEIFVGHRTHQSARYRIDDGKRAERHSSSGVICATGTGSTGWARSISEQRGLEGLPDPEEERLSWFVREPFPSVATQTGMDFGRIDSGDRLLITSEMGEGGVIFADGIEADWIEFVEGQEVAIRIAPRPLNLVTGDARGETVHSFHELAETFADRIREAMLH
jgi:hypothetical protein